MTFIADDERTNLGLGHAEAGFRQPPELAHGDIELRLRNKFRWGAAGIPGVEFTIRHAGEDAGRLTVLLDSDLQRLGRQGNVGARVDPRFRGRDFPSKAVEAAIPMMREHGLGAVVITCDPDSMPILHACKLLNAEFLDTLEAPAGGKPKQRYVRPL